MVLLGKMATMSNKDTPQSPQHLFVKAVDRGRPIRSHVGAVQTMYLALAKPDTFTWKYHGRVQDSDTSMDL